MFCDVYWGSHGCDLPPGHDGTIHQCTALDLDGAEDGVWLPCSEYDTKTGHVRHNSGDSETGVIWGEWLKSGSKEPA